MGGIRRARFWRVQRGGGYLHDSQKTVADQRCNPGDCWRSVFRCERKILGKEKTKNAALESSKGLEHAEAAASLPAVIVHDPGDLPTLDL